MQAWVYDLSQRMLGASRSDRRLRELLDVDPAPRVVLDVGGGTGISEPLAPRESLYICFDLDATRLAHFVATHPGREAICGDAAHLPIATGAVDLMLCRGVFHHLDTGSLKKLLNEAHRVLSARGSMVWLEPVWSPRWLPGRVLWQVDQGSHPRTEDELRTLIEAGFEIDNWQDHAIYHRYALGSARPRRS